LDDDRWIALKDRYIGFKSIKDWYHIIYKGLMPLLHIIRLKLNSK
jgi:hypothetical protein